MIDLDAVVTRLARHYGPPEAPITRDPFEMIVLENVAYLAPDQRREEVFRKLQKRAGTTPARILAAPLETLREIAALGGMYPDVRAQRLREAARLARDEFGGDLRTIFKLDFAKARRALKKFPVIGEPGAEKILLFGGAHCHLALESNGLRVLVRLGAAEEHKNYATTYRRVQDALAGHTGTDCERLVSAHLLLKRHGQETCRRSDPSCNACPLRKLCPYGMG